MNQTSPTERTALIAGCGIAGPVLAIFLTRIGLTPVIYEGQPEPRDDAGAFLNLAPNGLAVLDTLGLRAEIEALGTPTTSIAFFNHQGRKLGENPERTLLIKRGLLTKALREAALRHGVAIEFGKRLEAVERPESGVIARFEDGSGASSGLLVGADGIHSRTRRAVMPDAPRPEYTGVIDSGGFTRSESVPPSNGVMRMTFGLKCFFGYQKAPSGEIFWFQNVARPAEPDRDTLEAVPASRWRQMLLDVHRDDHAPIAEIIGSSDGGIGRWPIFDMPSLATWHAGRVCLIGDAAHAISPHAGQGASLAMEDAIVLAQCLRDLPEVEDAFAAFERLRKDRVETIVQAARRIGNQKAPSNGLARRMRDLILPFFLKMAVKSAERVYAYRVRWEAKAA